MGQTADIYLSIGTNLGERESNLKRAIDELESSGGKLIESSSIYKTSAWGNADLNEFLNIVIRFGHDASPNELLKIIKEIETRMGREVNAQPLNSKRNYQNRIIDIDILYYDQKVIDNEELNVPHLQLHLRRFVLEPLREIAPRFIHPLLKKSTIELYDACPDQNKVELHS